MQIFPRSINRLPLLGAVAVALGAPGVVFLVWYYFSPWFTQVGYAPKQPVQYSHRLHAGQLGMDCRYCHTGVETAAIAMVPPTQTCMNCHSVVMLESQKLEPIRKSWKDGSRVEWVRVHKLPDHAYFDHSAHVSAGVGCVECHGRVDQMEVVRQVKPLSMGFCLECHRDVKANQGASLRIRPVSMVTSMDYTRPAGETVKPPRTLNPPETCTGCHR